MKITCEYCDHVFEANEDTVSIGGESPFETVIFIECPNCYTEKEIET